MFSTCFLVGIIADFSDRKDTNKPLFGNTNNQQSEIRREKVYIEITGRTVQRHVAAMQKKGVLKREGTNKGK